MDSFVGRPFDVKPGVFSDSQTLLKETFRLPPGERSLVQLYEVANVLSSNAFLSKFSGSDQIIELARFMQLQYYKPNTNIFNEGDPGDCFYIIHTGRVAIIKLIEGSVTKLRELGKGSSFGEISIKTGEPRTAGVVAIDHTELITLDKECYDRTIANTQSKHLTHIIKFFNKLPLFKRLPKELGEEFAKLAYPKYFWPNSKIIDQGKVPTGIFFLVSGSAKVVRRTKSRENFKDIVIDDLKPGDIICDFEYFRKIETDYSVICSLPSKTYYLDKDELFKVKVELLKEIRDLSRPYPNEPKIEKARKNERVWKDYKDGIYKRVLFEKRVRKALAVSHFGDQLRKPLPKMRRMSVF